MTWPREKFRKAFAECIDSKLFKDGLELFKLSHVEFAIADSKHQDELIDFMVRVNQEHNASFTVFDFKSGDLKPLFQEYVTKSIDNLNSIIMLNPDKQIIGHFGLDDMVPTSNSTNDSPENSKQSVAINHAYELQQHVRNMFFQNHTEFNRNSFKFGEFAVVRFMHIDPKYTNSGLFVMIYPLFAFILYNLGYKYVSGISTTTRTTATATRIAPADKTIMTATYNYSQHVFKDGSKVSDYIEKYAQNYGVNKTKLIKMCIIQFVVTNFSMIDNFNVLEGITRWIYKRKYNKKIKKAKL